MKEMKKRGNSTLTEQEYQGEDGEGDAPAPVAFPLPDMALPPSFDNDNPSYRLRFLERTSQFLARHVLDTHGWDHNCGYDGANLFRFSDGSSITCSASQLTLGLSIIKWRGDLAFGFNILAHFSVGRSSKVADRVGINNKMSGQITAKSSNMEHLALALTTVIPLLISVYKKL